MAVVAAMLVATGLLIAPAAAGTDKFRFKGEAAFALWTLDDDKNTSVAVSGFAGQMQDSAGSPDKDETVSVSVMQIYCDEDADEIVLREYWGFEEGDVHVPAGLPHGLVEGELVLEGAEVRSDDCDEFPYPWDGDRTDLGSHRVEVTGESEGIGDVDRSKDKYHEDFDGFKIRSQNMSRYREADANVAVAGLEDIGLPNELGFIEQGN